MTNKRVSFLTKTLRVVLGFVLCGLFVLTSIPWNVTKDNFVFSNSFESSTDAQFCTELSNNLVGFVSGRQVGENLVVQLSGTSSTYPESALESRMRVQFLDSRADESYADSLGFEITNEFVPMCRVEVLFSDGSSEALHYFLREDGQISFRFWSQSNWRTSID